MHTQLHGLEHHLVANSMRLLARALDYFNNVDDDEVLRLYEQSMAITSRVEGGVSVNMAVGETNLAIVHYSRAIRAHTANDLDREMANLEKSLPHYREAARIYRAINHVDKADDVAEYIVKTEDALRQCTTRLAAAADTRG